MCASADVTRSQGNAAPKNDVIYYMKQSKAINCEKQQKHGTCIHQNELYSYTPEKKEFFFTRQEQLCMVHVHYNVSVNVCLSATVYFLLVTP